MNLRRFVRRRAAGAFILAVISICTVPASALPLMMRLVALSDQPAPGTPDGVRFDGFGTNVEMNNAEDIVFFASLEGIGTNNDNDLGVWLDRGGNQELVFRNGDPAHGAPTGVHYNFSPNYFRLNSAGQVAFASGLEDRLATGDRFSHSLWIYDSGVATMIARGGEQAAGMPPDAINDILDQFSFNDRGQIAYLGQLTNRRGGVWSAGSGMLRPLAIHGEQVAGLPSGVRHLGFTTPLINNLGQTAFYGTIADSDVFGDEGLWSDVSGALQLVARRGEQAADTPDGVMYAALNRLFLNNAGHIVFKASLKGSGINSTNNQAIWSDREGSLAIVARNGAPAPGTPSGENYRSFDYAISNDADHIAFAGTLIGPGVSEGNDYAVWSDSSGTFNLIAREGSQAVGMQSGMKFTTIGVMGQRFNNAGQFAFVGIAAADGGPNAMGLWATDRSGELQLVVKSGDVLEVAPGDFRAVQFLYMGDVNDFGQIAFSVMFTDRTSGVFVSNAVAVPEPESFILASHTALALVIRRRARRLLSA